MYFDTRAYDNAKGHTSTGEEVDWHHVYLKLEPWSKSNRALMQEGEGTAVIIEYQLLVHDCKKF